MNRFRNVPALITLLAGFITSVIMIVYRYPLINFMWILIAVMVVFYICGVIIRYALNKVVQNKEAQDKAEQDMQLQDAEDKQEATDAE